MAIGLCFSIFFNFWVVLGLSGSIVLHLFSSSLYDKDIDLQRQKKRNDIPDNFDTVLNEITSYNGTKLVTNDAENQQLQYYAYWINSLTSINKVVIVHHGIHGSRFGTYPFIHDLMQVPTLSNNTLFISYDARGWNDGKARGKPTYGVKEAIDLFNVIKHIEKVFQPPEIITYGFSMGGGTIYNLLLEKGEEFKTNNNVKYRFIIDSGYYNLKDQLVFFTNKLLGVNLGSLIMGPALWMYGLDKKTQMSFDAFEAVSTLNIDLMLLHSQADETVNWKFSCEMNKARNNNNLNMQTKTWIVPASENVGHVKLHNKKSIQFKNYVEEFLNRNFSDKGVNGCE